MNKKLLSAIIAGSICLSPLCSAAVTYDMSYAAQLIAGLRNVTVIKDNIAVGESISLILEWTNGAKPEISFSSSDESVAAVDENGTVTGIGSGNAEITVTTANNAKKSVKISVSADIEPSVCYNTSELKLGDRFRKYDTIHYDSSSIISTANVINTQGSYDLEFISEKDYILPFDAELVGIDGMTIYIAPQIDELRYIDGRLLSAGDVVDTSCHLLCYDYIINQRVLPVFLPKYYEKYIGEGTIMVKNIDHQKKTITLEAVQEEPAITPGDINNDGLVTVADAILLQKWLLAVPDAVLPGWRAADLNGNDIIDTYDMCIMRRILSEDHTDK